MSPGRVTIGEAADVTGLSQKAIRLYETRGLLEAPERTAAGYRTYGPEDLAVLRFIRQAKAVGLRLDEVGRILDLQRSGEQPCTTVIDLLDRRVEEIDSRLKDLRQLRRSLVAAREQAERSARSGQSAVICSVIESARV